MEANEYYRYRYLYDALVALPTCNGDDLGRLEFALEGVRGTCPSRARTSQGRR